MLVITKKMINILGIIEFINYRGLKNCEGQKEPRTNPGASWQSSGLYPRYDCIKSSSIYN